MSSVLVTLGTWAVLFASLWWGAHRLYYPPADWIGSALASFFLALGIGGLRKARLEGRDAAILETSKDGLLRDGERVAVCGTFEPAGTEVLHAPLSGEPCLAYDWDISYPASFVHPRRDRSNDGETEVARSGMALAPTVIRSGGRTIRLLAYPGLEGFDRTPSERLSKERARSYLESTRFEEHSLLREMGDLKKLTGGEQESFRFDWKVTDVDALDHAILDERCLPVGAAACVIGRYSAEKNAIVPQANVGGVRAIKGTYGEALEDLRASRKANIGCGIFLMLVPALVVWAFVAYREYWLYVNHRPNVRDAKQGMVDR